ncbi:MAG: leishmanolysin-related zinc metalloendopeptidase [Actinophytocola sp.]|uniref:leishmanolysin-related zinc metalloendopeptidase n=1 Tax=Actinophytocola sp. TaxID=1872138 RepID=UPI003C73796F
MADYLDVYISRADAGRAKALTGTTTPFTITVRFTGGLTRTQQDAFVAAADRWARVIVGDLPDVELDGEVIDDVLVLASGEDIDGEGNVLGMAGPTHVRVGGAPCRGEMRFDSADLAAMERDGILIDVITHEMGHVLGIGTLWEGLVQDASGADPRYTGRVAMVEYGRLTGSNPEAVPVEDEGGPGSRGSHWRESVFRNELMSSGIGGVNNPISRLTVACLIDLGYQVDLDAAEPYTFPIPIEGAALTTRRLAGHFERPTRLRVSTEETVT